MKYNTYHGGSMRRLLIGFCLLSIYAYGQCLSGPLSTRVGIRAGLVYSSFDPEDSDRDLDGIGLQFGLGMGTDFMNMLSIELIPQIRTTSFGRTDETIIGTIKTTFSYTNIYLPVLVSIKAGTLPLVNPYLGIGCGGNFQISGNLRIETNGSAVEYEIESDDRENDLFLIGALGADIKLANILIVPELSLNYNLTADLPNENNPNLSVKGNNIDFHFSIGLYYSP